MGEKQSVEESREFIGEILVKRGNITAAQLEQGLAHQAKEYKLLGETLVALGFVEEDDIIAALIVQCGVPYVSVHKFNVSPEILKLVPETLIREYCLLPVDRNADALSVVMADPLKKDVVAKIAKASGLRIAPFISAKNEIEKAINKYFGAAS